MNILHVSSHYGGGVGTVTSALINNDPSNAHRRTFLNAAQANDGELFNVSMIDSADIVVCHVWNHPSMFDFLVNTPLPPCRLAIWSHVSGIFAPDIYSSKLLTYPDRFVFTTPISYDCREVRELPQKMKDRLDVVWSTYDVKAFNIGPRIPHDGFNVGYIGTVNYGKLHSQFVEMCSAVKSPVKFVVVSNDPQDHLRDKAESLGISYRFDFKGRVKTAAQQLASWDIFGYPLQPAHFGSCEQAIGEAMVCGAVPVVLGNPTERYIIRHMETGLVVENINDYSKAIDFLFNNRAELARMSENAQADSRKRYDINRAVSRWNEIFQSMIGLEKKYRMWGTSTVAPYRVFATSLGVHGKPFVDYVTADLIGDSLLQESAVRDIKALYASNPAFSSDSKGSIKQYLRYYPNDLYLQKWAQLLPEASK